MIKYQNGIMDSLFRSHLWIGGVGALKDVVEMQKSGLVVRDGSAQTCARLFIETLYLTTIIETVPAVNDIIEIY